MQRGPDGDLQLGVEEEFLLVDTATGEPAPRIGQVIDDATDLAGEQAQTELHRAQIESDQNQRPGAQ